MPETEKITINLNLVDLGKIDLLVEEGFYSNRTDFIRAAIRRQLDQHDESIRQSVSRKTLVMGVLGLNRKDLEKSRLKGEKLDLRVVGLLVLGEDIPPSLASETIESVKVYGVLRASPDVQAALQDKIQ